MKHLVAILLSLYFLCWANHSQAGSTPACEKKGESLFIPQLSTAFPEVQDHLSKGMTATFVHALHHPRMTGHFHCQIFFDLWEERYVVKSWGVKTAQETSHYPRWEAAMQHCSTIPWVETGRVEIKTQLNPVTTQQVDNTKRWLATKGIAANSDAIVGRAVNAFMDLDRQTTVERACDVGQ